MRCLHRYLPLSLIVLFVPAKTGCNAEFASSPVQHKSAASIAGVVYDPAAPLNARVTPLGGDGVRSFAVRYQGARGEEIPGLLMVPDGSKPRPCVLLLHGLGGSKGAMFLPALAFARRGYATLAIDISGHGERPRIGGSDPAALTLAEMRQAAAQTVVDLRRAVDFLQSQPRIDRSRIGFVGVSLGGILGGVLAAWEPRVRATALWSAGGDWGRLVMESSHPFARRLRGRGDTNARTVETQMAAVDPAREAGRIAPRPLLMLNGTRDTIVPTVCAEILYEAARPPKQMVRLPGGHVPNVMQMLDRTLSWLDKNLR